MPSTASAVPEKQREKEKEDKKDERDKEGEAFALLSHRQRKKMKRMLFNRAEKLSRKEKEKTERKSNRLKRKGEINEMLLNMSTDEREAWRKEAFRKKNEKLKEVQTTLQEASVQKEFWEFQLDKMKTIDFEIEEYTKAKQAIYDL